MVRNQAEFLTWMEVHVKPIMRYRMLACGTGYLMRGKIAAAQLWVRGFPESYIEAFRQASGVICLPRFPAEKTNRLSVVDFAALKNPSIDWQAISEQFHVGILASHDAGEILPGPTSYFLFGHLEHPPGPDQHYLMELLSPHMHSAMARALSHAQRPERIPLLATLSRRESELLQWLIAGRNTGEIARHTHRSAHTINNQIRGILRKLRANNRTEAIAVAMSMGLIQPTEPVGRTSLTIAQQRSIYHVAALKNPSGIPLSFRWGMKGGKSLIDPASR
jgi:DNA-binding CsgD family transcriptional regulator